MPARLRAILRAAKKLAGVTSSPGGKHFKLERDGFGCYPIPAHKGEKTEVPDVYIRAMCNHFGIDEAELRALL